MGLSVFFLKEMAPQQLGLHQGSKQILSLVAAVSLAVAFQSLGLEVAGN